MDQVSAVASSHRNSFNPGKTLRALLVAALASASVGAWCAPQAAPQVPAARPAAPKAAGVININTADAATLTELNGIGAAKAAAIIEHRKQHGPFKSVDQLAEVKGIGEKFIEKNRDRISVR